MNKFKKVLVGLALAGGVSCLAGAAACSENAPKFYTLTFSGSGLDYVMQGALAEVDANNESFKSGGTVKDGVEVRFTLSLGANSTGSPIITVNGETLTPDGDGVYSFIMKGDAKVEASGLGSIYNLTLSRFEEKKNSDGQTQRTELWVDYLDENGNAFSDDVVRVESGKPFKFKVKASPYYIQKFTVSCDTEILEPDENGVYTVSNLKADNTVSVSGLEMEQSFVTGRENCGSGTQSDPYLLSRPIDLFYFAYIVNSEFYEEFSYAYYKLEKDIDMEGEQLFVIGDYSNASAIFSGHFDGNGKKISNFFITDEVVNQTTFESAYLPYVGLFGYANASLDGGAAEIKDLTLEDFKVNVHAGAQEQITLAGSLLGYGVGVEISNCYAKGELIATGNNNQIMILGGLVGRLQAGYYNSGTTVTTFDSLVRASTTNVYIDGNGSPRSAGGIVGQMISTNVDAISYVLNSVSLADVSGAMHSGGIVGTLGMYSSVTDCYSASGVNANNAIETAMIDQSYRGAYAGGIVGFAEENTVIRGCVAGNAYLNAQSPHGEFNKKTGDFYGHCDEAGATATGSQSVHAKADMNAKVKGTPATSVFTALGWQASEWDFGSGLPSPKALPLSAAREIKVTVKNGETDATVDEFTRKLSAATPIYSWYKTNNSLPEYITSGNLRSWGYYFDKAMTEKVPEGYVPAHDITVYAGFADYAQIAGRYYLSATTRSSDAYLELNADGTYMLRNGGMYRGGTYTYSGSKILLYNAALAKLEYASDRTGGYNFAFEGAFADGKLTLGGRVTLVDTTTDANGNVISTSYSTEDMQFTAVREDGTFKYGEYLDADGVTYTFYKNGTGRLVENSITYAFTFVIKGADAVEITQANGTKLSATMAGGEITTIDSVTVSYKDIFLGEWRKSANSAVSFTFDGLNNVVCSDGKTSEKVSYTSDGKVASFTWNSEPYKASFTDDGILIINNEEYFVADGFTGTWFLPGADEVVNVTLGGVGANGFGHAVIAYTGGVNLSVNVQYDVFRSGNSVLLRLFAEDREYGELQFRTRDGKAVGRFYSALKTSYYTNAEFSLYDVYRGIWACNSEDIDTLNFNGRTALGDGTVTVKTVSGRTSKGTYRLTDGNSGTVTVKVNGEDKTYNLSFNEFTNKVVLAETGAEIELAQRDEWYLAVLTDGTKTYKFDGKGYIGGTVEVSDGTKLSYRIDNGVVTLGTSELTPAQYGFSWGTETLTFNEAYEGRWLVGGTQEVLTIEKIGGDFSVQVRYSGAEDGATFVYNPSTGALTLTEDVGGVRVITTLSLMRAAVVAESNELSLSRNGETISCLREGGEDEYRGTYTARDDTSWEFDGLGACKYGSGTAIYTENGISYAYKYKIDVQGIVSISTERGLLFIPAENDEYGYTKGGKTYVTVEPDSFYGDRMFIQEKGSKEWYYFDGRSTMWHETEDGLVKAYTYKILSAYRLELTDTSGKVYIASMERVGTYYSLDLKEKAN